MQRLATFLLGSALVLTASYFALDRAALAADKPNPQPDKAAVERARKNVQMLDHIYKQAVVLITDKYVNDKDDFAAGSAAVALFDAVTKQGSHKVRLIDATGEPYEPENVAKDAFEKEGIKRLLAGAAQYEQIEVQDGKPQLRVVTAVPVVMKKCIMCHAHYADVKEGAPIGAISYTMPIE
jgi:hypothetical protein